MLPPFETDSIAAYPLPYRKKIDLYGVGQALPFSQKQCSINPIIARIARFQPRMGAHVVLVWGDGLTLGPAPE